MEASICIAESFCARSGGGRYLNAAQSDPHRPHQLHGPELEFRERNAGILASHLQDLDDVRVPEVPAGVQHAYYKSICYLDGDRDAVMQDLNRRGIPATIGSCSEIYREKALEEAWPLGKRLSNAKRLQETSLCLQVHPTLQEEHMHGAGEALAAAIRRCR